MADDFLDKELMKELGVEEDELDLPPRAPATPRQPQATRPAPPLVNRSQASAQAPTEAPAQPPVSAPKNQTTETDVDSDADDLQEHNRSVAEELPVHLAAVMAKQSLKLKDVLALKTGELIDFRKAPTDPIDLVANGKLVAKAELVLIDGRVGARIVKLIK